MAKLEYTFKNDTLFKVLFVRDPDLLKRLVAELLGIKLECIQQFEIRNPEMPPESLGDKFCRLDINMGIIPLTPIPIKSASCNRQFPF